MKLLEANAGNLTNVEVLQLLRGSQQEESKAGPPSRIPKKTELVPERPRLTLVEEQVLEYLKSTPAGTQTLDSAREFLKAVEPLKLTRMEQLQALNLRPTLPVEVDMIVDSWEQRLGHDGRDKLIELVERHLPPATEDTSAQ